MPSQIIIYLFVCLFVPIGHSESPRRHEEKRNGGVLSPARSDPSLESSLKSEHSSSKKTFTQSIAIPGTRDRPSLMRDQHTLTSPRGKKHHPTQPTYQEFKYGTNRPPVVAAKEEPKKEDEKIYQKIIREYDVV